MKMFRLSACILLACLFLTSCKKDYKPEFKTVLEQDFSGLHKKTAKYSAYVVFTNAGENTFTIDNLVADLLVDGKDAATVVFNGEMEVRPNSEFKVPVRQSFDPDDVFKADEEGSYPKSVKAELKGELVLLNQEGERVGVAFEHSETVNLNIKKELRKEKKAQKKAGSVEDEKLTWKEKREKRKSEKAN